MTRPPRFCASSMVRSVEQLSIIRISSAHRRLSMARAMLRSSLKVMIVAVIFMRSQATRADGCEREAQDEYHKRDPCEPAPVAGQYRGVVHNRMVPPEPEQDDSPHRPAQPEFSQ